MNTRINKWAAAATVAAAIAVLLVLTRTVPAAYGIEQVIEAYNKVRYLHVKTFGANAQQAPNEFWIKSDDSGKVAKARYYLPVTEDGAKLITWTPEKAEIWFQSKRGFLILQTKRILPWMQGFLEQSQPQLVLKRLQEQQKAGEVDIQIQNAPGEQKPGTMTAIRKNAFKKAVYYLDPKTDLITHIEYYNVEGGSDVLQSRTEFCDYNVPLDDKMFSLQAELPNNVRVADQLSQLIGVPQGSMTDEQAAAETVRQFFQALLDKDYKKAGLIVGGEIERCAKDEYGKVTVTALRSIGPSVPQPDWMKRGFKVPCEIEVISSNGQKTTWTPAAYVRPGDDEAHPDRWNISGGVNADEAAVEFLQDYVKYANMSAKEVAEAFFKACAEQNWDEAFKFWPQSSLNDQQREQLKEYLGGLEIVSIGEPYQTNRYPGWYVPYEIKLRPTEINVRVSNTNSAKRYVMMGVYDRKMRLQEEIKWSNQPEALATNDPCATMSPADVVKAYFDAMSKSDWTALRKLTSDSDVEETRQQFDRAEKHGIDARHQIPVVDVGEAVWSAEQSACFVKCRVLGYVKKFNLAVRNDNPATGKRFLVDGGI